MKIEQAVKKKKRGDKKYYKGENETCLTFRKVNKVSFHKNIRNYFRRDPRNFIGEQKQIIVVHRYRCNKVKSTL